MFQGELGGEHGEKNAMAGPSQKRAEKECRRHTKFGYAFLLG